MLSARICKSSEVRGKQVSNKSKKREDDSIVRLRIEICGKFCGLLQLQLLCTKSVNILVAPDLVCSWSQPGPGPWGPTWLQPIVSSSLMQTGILATTFSPSSESIALVKRGQSSSTGSLHRCVDGVSLFCRVYASSVVCFFVFVWKEI